MITTPKVRFLILPCESFSLLALGGFIDKLRFTADEADLSEQKLCSWAVVGNEHRQLASCGIHIEVDHLLDDIELQHVDYLVLFGSRTARQAHQCASLYASWLRKAAAHNMPLVAIDNATFTLAELGLLEGYEATIHWRHEQEFRDLYPKIQVHSDRLFSFDRKRITCSGGSASVDLAAEILSRHFDKSRALKGLADMLIDESREPFHQLRSDKDEQYHHPILNRAIRTMRQQLDRKQTIEQIADSVGLSRRQLDRLFEVQTQQSAHQYWLEMKLQYVYWRLLNSSTPLTTIADEVAICDTSYLSKLITKRFGDSPSHIRSGRKNNALGQIRAYRES
ncbi:GlxA family transcriptional regulator [Vibrio coralliilyticus]|uniref:GlxA family transcriptional regulator n=1 Tax=Vibrio coralliilyticus TaxID=190893 RepID=UPI0006CCE052|nr:helix-turn-helix domain-containing protein [Vibrio coralliilyticus]AXN33634.1 AraC family transcriptional regulator [Vibrio coralliilyticus]KPH23252.1 AraC family transcriptional regulator [Vibrio coralliilyticus]